MVTGSFNQILENLKAYKRKYYLNMILRGTIYSFSILSVAYVAFNLLEYYGRFDTPVRIGFFFSYILITGFVLVKWVFHPAFKLFSLNHQMTDEEASVQIGKYFPEIQDKLLNAIQLQRLSTAENALVQASIAQRTKDFSVVPFVKAVDYGENRRRARFLIIPFFTILTILMFVPQLFVESTSRIINYNQDYVYPAPFQFFISNKKLSAFKNEDYELRLSLKGSVVPDNVYIISNGKRTKMRKESLGNFVYDFKNLQRSENFQFEAAGYNSANYKLEVFSRPDLRSFEASLRYPAYLNKKDESLKNAGNLTVPEGTTISWEFNAVDADNIHLKFSEDKNPLRLKGENNIFRYSKRSHKSENYEIELENNFSKSKEKISYYINVIPDQFPTIQAEQFTDTVLFNFITLGGSIADDYGVTSLKLFYRITKNQNDNSKFLPLPISIDSRSANQNFFYNWKIDSLVIDPGQNIEYYLQVWDNDGVNGSKSSKTRTFTFHLPTEEEIRNQISTSSKNAENQLDKALKKSKELENDINKIENKLKTKNNLNWQDKKALEEVLKKHEELKKDLEELKKLNETLNEKNEKFNEIDPETAYKMEQLQKLMNELLDDETKKLFEELKKLLEEQHNKQDIQKILEELKKDDNLQKDLDRAMEMFKQLQFEQKLDKIVDDLNKLSEKQENLSEKTSEKKESNEKLMEEQQKLNEEFEKIQKEMKELSEINESLENKKEMENTSEEESEINKEQKNSTENLKNENNKKAENAQKNAAEKMKKLSDKLDQMKSEMQQQENEENLDALRDILENLITLSFDQEELMKEFRKVNHSDPRYLSLSQKQLKLIEDSKVIEDSLLALAKRVFQIQSFVTREVGLMEQSMEESLDALKDRRVDIATGKQQFAMTSMNNLALLLNDALKQMQEQMAESMKNGQGKMCKKPGKKPQPGLGELQKQLNEQIQKLKEGGKTGRQLSEELAKLAAQQEMIRNALKELEKSGGNGKAGDELKKLQQEMEETEKNLVNKQLSQELINRQKEILTRLLEAEKSMREQGEEERREAEKPKETKTEIPPSFEKYLKAKEKEIDLLKTAPPTLTPYYKQEVNEYFQKIEK
ncbi:MAG: DUF4175 family protein [Cytophagaceae bacterium]|nr:DUF4175 family protein [Cytophagaceae bacterium]